MFSSVSRRSALILLALLAVWPALASSDDKKDVEPFTLEDAMCRANAMVAHRWRELDREPGMSYENSLMPGQSLITTHPMKVTDSPQVLPIGTRVVIVERLHDGLDYRIATPELSADRVLAVKSNEFYQFATIAKQIEFRDRIAALRNQFLAELDVILLRDHGLTYEALNNMKIVPRNGILCLSNPD